MFGFFLKNDVKSNKSIAVNSFLCNFQIVRFEPNQNMFGLF